MSYFKVICIKDLNKDEEIDSFLYDDVLSKWKNAEYPSESKFVIEVIESSDVNQEGERFQTYEKEFDI